MNLICEISRHRNSTALRGKCYQDQANSKKLQKNSQNLNDLIRTLSSLNSTTSQLNLTKFNSTHQRDLDYYARKNDNAATYVIIVLCFYSLSLVCLIFSNVKFNCVFRKSLGLRQCYASPTKTDLYDLQQQETKETIELLFSHSSKLLASPVVSLVHIKNLSEELNTPSSVESDFNSTNNVSKSYDLRPSPRYDKHYDKDLSYTLV